MLTDIDCKIGLDTVAPHLSVATAVQSGRVAAAQSGVAAAAQATLADLRAIRSENL